MAVAGGAAGERHFGVVNGQPVVFVIKSDGDGCHAGAGALGRAGEDHVFGFVGAQQGVRLLAQHPAQGVGNVGFARAVGAHNGGNPRPKLKAGAVGEGFVALKV